MEKQKMGHKIKQWGLLLLLAAGYLLTIAGPGMGEGLDFGPFPWGLSLEEINGSFNEKNQIGQVREDKYRTEIELQYAPTKAIKARKGNLSALIWTSNPSMAGRLYGYTYDGKFFGRVIFFKDHPEIFPETVIGTLKGKYPQGRTYRSFTRDHFISLFEYKSEQLYVFNTERGIFFYDPNVLEKVIKKYQSENELEMKKFEEKQPEAVKTP
jgi:hypothetical protein